MANPEQENEEYRHQLECLRRDIQVGVDQINRGESTDGEKFMKRLIDQTD